MATSGMNRTIKFMMIAVASLLVLAVSAAAVVTGIVEPGRRSTPVSEVRTSVPEPTVAATLSVMRPTAAPQPDRTPAPSPTWATKQVPTMGAVAPEVIGTVQADAPVAGTPPASPETARPEQ